MNIGRRKRLLRKAKWIMIVVCAVYMVGGIKGRIMDGTSPELEQTVAGTNKVQITESLQPIRAKITENEGQMVNCAEFEYPFGISPHVWNEEQIAGFKEYQIPDEFSRYGGYFPLGVQRFTYFVCKEFGVGYSLILATIEIESGYRYDAVSSCNAIGYMQLIYVWHVDRMKALGVADIENPYNNILIGVDYMAELLEQYPTSVALSAYNRGLRNKKGTGALDLVDKGIYQTEYSEMVLNRAAEIEKELSK